MSRWISPVALALLVVLLWPGTHSQAALPPALGITPTPTTSVEPTPRPTLPAEPTPTPLPTPTSTPRPPADDDDGKGVDPVITKRGEPGEVRPGDVVTFTIEVTNQGQHAAVDVVVTDDIPEYLEILEVTTTQGTVTIEGQRVTVHVGVVGPAFVVEIVIRTRVRADTPAPTVMENVAVLKSPNGGERVTPPVLIRILGQGLPKTGGIRPGRTAIALAGSGIVTLGLVAAWIEQAWVRRREGAGH